MCAAHRQLTKQQRHIQFDLGTRNVIQPVKNNKKNTTLKSYRLFRIFNWKTMIYLNMVINDFYALSIQTIFTLKCHELIRSFRMFILFCFMYNCAFLSSHSSHNQFHSIYFCCCCCCFCFCCTSALSQCLPGHFINFMYTWLAINRLRTNII